MSQKELAQVLDVSQQAVYKYENGLAEPELGKLIRIADYFGVSMDYLVGRSGSGTDAEVVPDSAGRIVSLSGLGDDDIEAVHYMVSFLRRKNRS